MSDLAAYLSMFSSALVAATLLPAQSEAVLVSLVLGGAQPVWALVTVASAGNVLGAVINWALGRSIERFRDRRWFPVGPAALASAQTRYQRWGKWSLLLSWMPIIGDPLTLAAGFLREPLPVFLLFVTIAKTARYLVLVALIQV
ncbi:MAG: DedA family protein [Gammaproteobacteria bacterium]|jgi:membrane protein YqaA with SNARE-associated domain|nr:DedA family protein [Gammaproteobacteria bacterium]